MRRSGGGGWRRGARLPLRRPPPPGSRLTCKRTAPPNDEPLPSSPAITSAAPDSHASLVRRTATPRDTTGAESMTTSANAPHRSSTSAHHAARDGSRGRIIHNPSSSPRWAQSRGASVRVASMYATHPASLSVCSTICRSSVAFPLPRAPTTSVNRPRGNPPPANPASSASTPVASVRTPAPAGAVRGRGRRSTRDCGSILGFYLARGPPRCGEGGANKLCRIKTESKKEACCSFPLVFCSA
jgi:hypothetical protein